MKKSRFNVVVPLNGNESLVYNTLRGSISKVNSNLLSLIENKDSELVNSGLNGLGAPLKEQGIIVDLDFDELKEYEKMHLKWKEGKENVEFNALLTYDCNFECPYCYQGRGEEGRKLHGFRYMDEELLNSLKSFMKKTTLEREAKKLELVLYGGEPFLPKSREMGKRLTEEMAEWTDKQDIDFGLHVLTNGSLTNNLIVDWLSGYNARLQIPVDGDQKMHDKYRYYKRSKRGSFEDIIKILAMTRDTNVETHIRISLTDETYPTMERLLDQLKSHNLTHVYPDFCYITAFTDACETFKDHTFSDAKLFKIMPEMWRKAHERGFPLDIRPRVQPLPCSSVADGSYIVDPFAEVYKCWELVGLKKHAVGRLDFDGNLEKTKIYSDVLERNPLKIEKCKGHVYLPSCGGGCVCKAQWQHKTYQAPGCGTEKYLLKDKIKIYTETLDLSMKLIHRQDDLELQVIEGEQKPRMSHCYVLV